MAGFDFSVYSSYFLFIKFVSTIVFFFIISFFFVCFLVFFFLKEQCERVTAHDFCFRSFLIFLICFPYFPLNISLSWPLILLAFLSYGKSLFHISCYAHYISTCFFKTLLFVYFSNTYFVCRTSTACFFGSSMLSLSCLVVLYRYM